MRRRTFLSGAAASGALLLGGRKSVDGSKVPTIATATPKTDLELFSESQLTPAGEYYDATVPDMLDLAEHARLGVRGLINFLDADRDYEPYQQAFSSTNPPYMSTMGADGPN
jgi:hypothetical protein